MNCKEQNGSKACRTGYESPEITVVGILSEGILCESGGETIWYEKGGEGDFKYDTTTDSIWG